jgi:hypothetical protein
MSNLSATSSQDSKKTLDFSVCQAYPFKKANANDVFASVTSGSNWNKSLKIKGDVPLIVSLTSYPPRFRQLHLTLKSIIQQSLVADKIILWINVADRELLPKEVTDLVSDYFEILLLEGTDLKSYKKIIPTLRYFPTAIIVTCDDDAVYYSNWLWDLYLNSLREKHSKVLCHRANLLSFTPAGAFAPYQQWKPLSPYDDVTSLQVFPTGIGGVLYPPRCFHPDVQNLSRFLELAPDADDIWLYFMSTLAGIPKRKLATNFTEPPTHDGSQVTALWRPNATQGGNDQQLAKMLAHYQAEFCAKVEIRPPAPPVPPAPAAKPDNSFPGSANFWESRYQSGGNSGAGSYRKLAEFKAQTLNSFIQKHNLSTVIEFGHGDGNQLKLATYKSYLGFDVSTTAVNLCKRIFAHDPAKRFKHIDEYIGEKAQLTLSLDVIFHLVEDEVFAKYMARLFDASEQFVAIYSSDDEVFNVGERGQHVKHRKFTAWVSQHRPGWKLVDIVKNIYPRSNQDPENTSFSDFYFYQKLP